MSDLTHALEVIGLVFTAISGLLNLLTKGEKWLTSPIHVPPAPVTRQQQPSEPGVPAPSSTQ